VVVVEVSALLEVLRMLLVVASKLVVVVVEVSALLEVLRRLLVIEVL